MKNILFIIMIIPCFVYAETFYTDYKFIKEDTKLIPSNSFIKREEIIKYSNYKNVRTNEEYLEYSDEHEYVDKNDYIFEETILDEKNNDNMRVLSYDALTDFLIDRIYIETIGGPNNYLLEQLNIYYENEVLKSYNNVEIKLNSPRFNILLGDKLELEKIKIYFQIDDFIKYPIKYRITFYNDDKSVLILPVQTERYDKNDSFWLNFNSDDVRVYNDILVETTKYKEYFLTSLKKYKYYDLKREYLDYYSLEPLDGYLLDKEKYIKSYKYFQKYYITLTDDLIDSNNLYKLILDTNMDINKITLTNKDGLVHLTYDDFDIYKKYESKIITTKQNIITTNQIVKINSSKSTTLLTNNTQMKERNTSKVISNKSKNLSYLYIILIVIIVILYILFVR